MSEIKLIVWDADDTLWEGIAINNPDVKLKIGIPETLKELSKRGIKNIMCSKNDEDYLMKIIKKLKLKDKFVDFFINWKPKSENINEILRLYNLKQNEALFIDDSNFERAEVQSRFQEINVLLLENPLDVLRLTQDKNITEEDEKRIEILQEQIEREKAEHSFKGSFTDFLMDCNMELKLRFAEEKDLQRIFQLLDRTTELNLTNNHYEFKDLASMFNDKNFVIIVADLKDKFGDYGLIGEIILRKDSSYHSIIDFCVSCRTMGRGIGSALLTTALNYIRKENFSKVVGFLRKTKKNYRVVELYEQHHFNKVEEKGNAIYYSFNFKKPIMRYEKWLKVNLNI